MKNMFKYDKLKIKRVCVDQCVNSVYYMIKEEYIIETKISYKEA